MKYTPIIILILLLTSEIGLSQVNYGFISGFDLYQRYVNPADETGYDRSAGSAILNMSFGPRIWFGGEKCSFSLESYLNYGALALNAQEYKGLGAISFPVIAKLNFKGMSGFGDDFKGGWAIGGGIQYQRTELYGLQKIYKEAGVTRNIFPVYVVELGFGGGFKSSVVEFFIRYGLNPDIKASSLNIGFNTVTSLRFRPSKEELKKLEQKEEPIFKM